MTQEQFEKLAKTVRRLQEKFGPVGSASFPENIQLMHELRKGASLTDAMAALQLSARLEASEKALKQMMSLVTDLASKTSGIDLTGGGTGAVRMYTSCCSKVFFFLFIIQSNLRIFFIFA